MGARVSAGDGGGFMYLYIGGNDGTVNTTVSLANITAAGNTAAGGSHRMVLFAGVRLGSRECLRVWAELGGGLVTCVCACPIAEG